MYRLRYELIKFRSWYIFVCVFESRDYVLPVAEIVNSTINYKLILPLNKYICIFIKYTCICLCTNCQPSVKFNVQKFFKYVCFAYHKGNGQTNF